MSLVVMATVHLLSTINLSSSVISHNNRQCICVACVAVQPPSSKVTCLSGCGQNSGPAGSARTVPRADEGSGAVKSHCGCKLLPWKPTHCGQCAEGALQAL